MSLAVAFARSGFSEELINLDFQRTGQRTVRSEQKEKSLKPTKPMHPNERPTVVQASPNEANSVYNHFGIPAKLARRG
jgi:hypothetical protein